MNRHAKTRRQAQGFTLLELMMVLIVIGILVGIAYPTYHEQIRKNRRAQARTDLVETVQKLERFHSARNTYSGFNATSVSNSQPEHYTVSISGTPDANTFSLQAVPQGKQASDKCGTLTINQAGTKGQSGANMTAQDCW